MSKAKKYVGQFLTVEEAEKLLRGIKGTSIEAMIVLTLNYGLRRGKAFGLRWHDIDFENKSIFICNTFIRVKEVIEKQPKSEASLRALPLIPHVEQYLLRLKNNSKRRGNSWEIAIMTVIMFVETRIHSEDVNSLTSGCTISGTARQVFY